jgi:hypothetical protein
METQPIPHHKAGGLKDEPETNWPVLVTLLASMTAFLICFYLLF